MFIIVLELGSMVHYQPMVLVISVVSSINEHSCGLLQAFGDPSFEIPISGKLDLHNAHHLLMILSFLTYCLRLVQVGVQNIGIIPRLFYIM